MSLCPPSPGGRELEGGGRRRFTLSLTLSRQGRGKDSQTLNESQAEFARRRVAAADLADRCAMEIRDYRTLGRAPTFGKLASVGMAEQVSLTQLPTTFGAVYRIVKPGGLVLIQRISTPHAPGPL